jgi:hypothetical protein
VDHRRCDAVITSMPFHVHAATFARSTMTKRLDMRSPTRCAHTRAALAVASLILLLAGCGGGGGGGDSKSTSASPTGTSANPTTTTAPATIPDTPASPTSDTPAPVAASTATLQWSAPQAMTDGSTVNGIVGYRVYYGPSVTKMDTKIDVMNPSISTYVVEGLTSGTYYFAVTALHSSGGESDRSNAGLKVIG